MTDDLPRFQDVMARMVGGGAEHDQAQLDELGREGILKWLPMPDSEAPLPGHWARFYGQDFDTVLLRLERGEDGRLLVTGVLVADDEEITARRLRGLRVSELLAVFRRPAEEETEPKGDRTVALYREALSHHPGSPVSWVAKELGVDRSTVHRRLRKAGITPTEAPRSK
jgi:hypothetical protein